MEALAHYSANACRSSLTRQKKEVRTGGVPYTLIPIGNNYHVDASVFHYIMVRSVSGNGMAADKGVLSENGG